jgi:hypothetical protein
MVKNELFVVTTDDRNVIYDWQSSAAPGERRLYHADDVVPAGRALALQPIL